jgi:hypothetical protein
MFTNGHKKVCKQLFIIEVIGDEEDMPLSADTEAPTISLHAPTDIPPCFSWTMQLIININGTRLTMLLDSESMHNFMDVEVAERVGIQLEARGDLHVAVADGDHIQSHGRCRNMPLTIAGELAIIDYYGLALRAHEMVLGVQWLESLGPIMWDFGLHVIQLMCNSHTVCWTTADQTPAPTSLIISTDNVMVDLLLRFDGIFTTPTSLSSVCPQSHQVHLLSSTTLVAVRPYRYAHAQKTELEE